MSRRFVLSTPAFQDLDQILSYVLEKSGPRRAKYVAARFEEAFQKLADSPNAGPRREDLTPSPVLFFTVWSWYVIYRSDKKPLEIARVIHGARDVETLLSDEPP